MTAMDLLFEALETECRRPRPRVGPAIEWLALRVIGSFIIGLFVTVGMALAG